VGSHNHRRVSEVSQDRAVTTPLSTGTFESELNDAVGLILFQVYHNFVLPHASLRQALAEPIPTNGSASAKVWRPCSPAPAHITVALPQVPCCVARLSPSGYI